MEVFTVEAERVRQAQPCHHGEARRVRHRERLVGETGQYVSRCCLIGCRHRHDGCRVILLDGSEPLERFRRKKLGRLLDQQGMDLMEDITGGVQARVTIGQNIQNRLGFAVVLVVASEERVLAG